MIHDIWYIDKYMQMRRSTFKGRQIPTNTEIQETLRKASHDQFIIWKTAHLCLPKLSSQFVDLPANGSQVIGPERNTFLNSNTFWDLMKTRNNCGANLYQRKYHNLSMMTVPTVMASSSSFSLQSNQIQFTKREILTFFCLSENTL